MRVWPIAAVVLLTSLPLAPAAHAAPPSTEAWYVMDREGWLRTDDERLVLTTVDLSNGPNLTAFPLELGDWRGMDLPIQNLETLPTLDAENLVYRGYVRGADGAMLVLSLIGSSSGQAFHHPIVCYGWASWESEDRGTVSVPLGGGDVVLRHVVGIDPQGPRQVDLHWYLWPDARRTWESGATQIRVTALANDGDERALAAARDFAGLLFAQARRPEPAAAVAPDPLPGEPPPFAPAMEPLPGEPPALVPETEPPSGQPAGAPPSGGSAPPVQKLVERPAP